MAQDGKYGHVTLEHGHIPDDEPVMVFRARDTILPLLIDDYRRLCAAAGSPQHHLDLIDKRYREIQEWQEAHHDRVHVPRSDGYHEAHRDHEADGG